MFISISERGDVTSMVWLWRSRVAAVRRLSSFDGRGRSQDGDTIVEVMIAIAIISLILASAYSITAKNNLEIQNTAERVQAQHLVEAQLESLKANNGLSSGTCFDATGAPTTGAGCTQTTEGSSAQYQLVVTQAAGDYTITAQWTSLGDHGTSNVTMYYRL